MDFYYSVTTTPKKLEEMCNGYSLKDLERMYVEDNQCMDLVAQNTGIDLPLLSEIINKSGLARKKIKQLNGRQYEKKVNEKNSVSLNDIKDDEDSVWSEL